MCGIAGIYNQTNNKHLLENELNKMLTVIRHRGPDESGLFVDGSFGMGNVRLSIDDIKTGQQPLSDESENFWITYNGEVFNAGELKAGLERKGRRFKTNCDTEVVVQMYAEYGYDCLKYLNGQFAFCIWDKKKQELFLARDRVGICPLFYWKKNDVFSFCSEIKGLFTLDFITKNISLKNLSQIFTFWTTLPGQTPFEDIYQVPPGHFMTVKGSKLELKRYWSLQFPTFENLLLPELSDAADHLSALLEDAVKMRLKADVPVAAYLSGGLDSSVTTSFIKKHYPEELKTFSIGFSSKEFDETKYQTEASEYFKTDHFSFKCTSEDIASHFEKSIWHTEFPTLRTSPTPMSLLSQKVHDHGIKVIITGEGADEFLGGYNIFKESKIRRFWASQPDSTCRPILLSRLYPYLSFIKERENRLATKMFFGYKLQETSNPLYSHLLRWHNTSRIKHFLSEDVQETIKNYDPLHELEEYLPHNFSKFGDLAKSQYLEIILFMSNYLLSSQGERMAMANSVEGRYPFLDHRVIEFCNNLPERYKLNGLNEKFILKRISKGKIPDTITSRIKQPYRAPVNSTFFSSGNFEFIKDLLSESEISASGLFNFEKVNTLTGRLQSNKGVSEIDSMAITAIISTQLVYKKFIKDKIRGIGK